MKGIWTKCLDATGKEYYYNASQNKSAWQPPPHEPVHVAANLVVTNNSDNATNQPIMEEGELYTHQHYDQQQQQQQQQQQYEMQQYQQQQYEFMLQYQQMNEQQQYEYMQQYQQQLLLQQQHAQFSQYNNVTTDSINDMLLNAAKQK